MNCIGAGSCLEELREAGVAQQELENFEDFTRKGGGMPMRSYQLAPARAILAVFVLLALILQSFHH
jgi:hypothetical protein